MGHCLVPAREAHHAADVISRFDPRFWTVNFRWPMMAAVTTTAPDALRVDCVFYRRDDLAGLIWEAMSDERTARLSLPLLHAGQAQKELDHNEALALLDLAVQPTVVAAGQDVPPSDPTPGKCWIVGASPVGAWAGRAQALAGWTIGGWRYVAPHPGMVVWRSSDAMTMRYDGAQWTDGEVHAAGLFVEGAQVVSRREPAIDDPAGGGTIDAEARIALHAILATLRNHGLIAG
jgi:hypothetical protein